MRSKVRIIINVGIAVVVFASWLDMFFGVSGTLSSAGISSLKYFTVLSNLLEGVACIVWLAAQFARHKREAAGAAEPQGAKKDVAGKAEAFKYVACVAVTITFLTVVLFLAPIYGMYLMVQGANFWLHMVAPLAAILEQLFLCDAVFTRIENRLTVLPVLIYGTGYVLNMIINGVGRWPATNDWYGFLNWGVPIGALIFAGLLGLSWLLGWLFRRKNRRA